MLFTVRFCYKCYTYPVYLLLFFPAIHHHVQSTYSPMKPVILTSSLHYCDMHAHALNFLCTFLSCLYALMGCHIECGKYLSKLSVSLFIQSTVIGNTDVAVPLKEHRRGSAFVRAPWEERCRRNHSREARLWRASMLVIYTNNSTATCI